MIDEPQTIGSCVADEVEHLWFRHNDPPVLHAPWFCVHREEVQWYEWEGVVADASGDLVLVAGVA